MAETKNIIFDLGGVLLDMDFQRSIDAFEKLGLRHPDLSSPPGRVAEAGSTSAPDIPLMYLGAGTGQVHHHRHDIPGFGPQPEYQRT